MARVNTSKNDQEIKCGAYLRHIRQQRGISLEKVSEKTKILHSLLKNLEEDNYDLLPPPAYLKGIIKRYAQFLKLNPGKVVNLYQKTNGHHLQSGKNDLLPQNRFLVNQISIFPFLRKILRWFFHNILFIIIGLYFLYEILLFLLPPRIVIIAPSTDYSTNQAKIVLKGKVRRGKALFLKGKEIPLNKDGSFQEVIILSPGLNEIDLKAVNNLGKTSFAKRNIIYNAQ